MKRPSITSLPGESASDVARRLGQTVRAPKLRRTPTLNECADCDCPTHPGEHTTDPITSARIRTAPCRRGLEAAC